MPVDTTRPPPSRRAQRKITEEELKDIELKRIRGELSCAECRRLKLRCDKKVPCSSCCRRGCESICPCGILSAGQGTRFILADTEQLHRKIAEMSHRIRQLEDALAILQSTVSGDRHPLLEDDLLKIKFGAEALTSQHSSSNEEEEPSRRSIDALGTLTLDDAGEVKYFGRSAGSETLMMAGEEWDTPSNDEDEDEEARPPLPPELENLANLFPFTKKGRPNTDSLELLESFLPSHERAWSLGESYLKHGGYFFRPIKRDELMNSFLPDIYRRASVRSQTRVAADASPGADDESEGSVDSSSPHALATLYFLFALGALLDLNLPPYNAEAEHYYDLGRAALSLRVVFDSPQVDTVQAMGLMATYHSLAGKKYSRDSAWCVASFASKLAQSIGLHRDSARWKMNAATVQKRRNLFWEIFAADVSHSLALGRPPAIHLSYVDCEFPIDEEATLSDTGEVQSGFWRMKHTFARDIFMGVVEVTLTAKSPSYNTVLNLDRRVREISFPANFKPYVLREDGEQEFHDSSLSLRGFYASQHRTVTMLYLHRSFFAQAMLDHPTNPLLSPFAPSFLTAYRCASVIIKASAHQFERCAEMAMRVWFLMYHTFSAAVIVGTVVTRSPNSNVASSALLDLGLAIELFERTAIQSQRARIALGVLRKLKEKAVRSFTQFCSTTLPAQMNSSNNSPTNFVSPSFGNFSSSPTDDVDDELAIFGGQTRVLSRKSRSKHSPTSGSGDTSSPSPPTDGSVSPPGHDTRISTNIGLEGVSDVHPSLVEYLKQEPFGQNMLPPPDQTTLVQAQYTQTINANRSGTSTPRSPASSGNQMGEIYSNFMGYLANKSLSNSTMNTSNTVPNSLQDRYRTAVKVSPGWNGKVEQPQYGLNRTPDTNSFGWLPSPPGNNAQIPSTPTSPPSGFYGNQNNTNFSPPLNNPNPANFIDERRSFNMFGTSQPEQPNVAMSVNPTGAMVELGLSTESGMDAGWLSFMQDCGIMETGRSG